MRLDILGLEAFLAIAERGSFQRAAGHLAITQTALSHRIRKFEDALGTKLIVRTTRSLALSPAGLSLLPKARQLLQGAQTILDELTAEASARQERIAIGCLPTLAVHFLPDIMTRFHALYPTMAVRIYDNAASEITERVHKGDALFGITILSANPWDLEVKPLIKEPYVLICPSGHELAERRAVKWSEIAGRPLIRISSQTGNRVLIDDALGNRRETMRWMFEVQHIASAVSLVAAGVGLTVVPRVAIDVIKGAGVTAVTLRDPSITRTLAVVTRRGVPLGEPATRLIGMIEAGLRARKA